MTSQVATVSIPWSLIVSGVASVVPYILSVHLIPQIHDNVVKIRRDNKADRALNYKTQTSRDNLFITDMSMSSLPRSHVNHGAVITPATSYSTIIDSTLTRDKTSMSSSKDMSDVMDTKFSNGSSTSSSNEHPNILDTSLPRSGGSGSHGEYPAVLQPTFPVDKRISMLVENNNDNEEVFL